MQFFIYHQINLTVKILVLTVKILKPSSKPCQSINLQVMCLRYNLKWQDILSTDTSYMYMDLPDKSPVAAVKPK